MDASGTTTYERDQLGRITTKTQRLINGDTRSVSYSYNAQGLLASTTYPGGQVLQHVYDTTGQLTGLTWAGQPLVSGITWNPPGPAHRLELEPARGHGRHPGRGGKRPGR